MSEQHVVFISYSTKNSDVANKICYLLEQNGLPCWIAPRNISSGRVYINEIADAIKSTKIVVLVYSKFSQESKYVNNEIQMAYSHNKPLISFNIDDSEPKKELEYFLKVSQWLPAFADFEKGYETLIKDSLELCDAKSDVPIHLDVAGYKGEDLSRHKRDHISLLLLFTPLYWASFAYMGLVANQRRWVVMGIVYLIPTVMYLLINFQILGQLFILYPVLSLFAFIFIIFWALAIIHGFVIRNEFLTRKAVLRFTLSDEKLFDYLYEEYIDI